jgi:hypothetical protein
VARIRVMIAEFGRQAHDVEPALAVLLRAHDSRPAARTVAVFSDPLKLLEARTSGEFAAWPSYQRETTKSSTGIAASR